MTGTRTRQAHAFRLLRRRSAAVGVSLLLATGIFTASSNSAFAAKQQVGNVTCSVGGSVSFNPPLTPTGTSGRHEIVTLTQTYTGCVEKSLTTNFDPHSVITKHFVLPAHSVTSGQKVVGDCPSLPSQLPQVQAKQIIHWGSGFATVKQLLQVQLVREQAGTIMHELGHNLSLNHGGGDNPAPIDADVFFAPAATTALDSCLTGTGSPISMIDIDATKSFVTLGPTVLTTATVGGPDATPGDLITASVVGGPNCTSGSAQATVLTNPAAPGTATLQLTSLTFAACTLDMLGVGSLPASVTVNGLPDSVTISDALGDPATSGILSITISVMGGTSSCSYASPAALTGGYTNATDSLTFSGSALAFAGGAGPLGSDCPTSSLTLPVFTSVADSSVSGTPAVFVN
jgi:hypothetical protein